MLILCDTLYYGYSLVSCVCNVKPSSVTATNQEQLVSVIRSCKEPLTTDKAKPSIWD